MLKVFIVIVFLFFSSAAFADLSSLKVLEEKLALEPNVLKSHVDARYEKTISNYGNETTYFVDVTLEVPSNLIEDQTYADFILGKFICVFKNAHAYSYVQLTLQNPRKFFIGVQKFKTYTVSYEKIKESCN